MGWVYEHLANFESNVKGILIGSDFDKKFDYSLKGIQNDGIYSLISKYKHPFAFLNKSTFHLFKIKNSRVVVGKKLKAKLFYLLIHCKVHASF